jgi:hypothetical protein
MLSRRPNVSADASVAQTHCRRERAAGVLDSVDWDRIRSAYGPLVQRTCTDPDMRAVLHEMLGHIAVSHALVRDPDPYVPALSQERSVQCQAWTLERERRVVELSRGQVDYCAPRGCLRADRVLVDRWLGYHEETFCAGG